MGRVGKELSTSRVVAGQTLLVGAANISLTPWQTNLTFVRASPPLCRLPSLFTLRLPSPYWRDWLFLSYKTAPLFSKVSNLLLLLLFPYTRKRNVKKKKEKKKEEKPGFLSIVISTLSLLYHFLTLVFSPVSLYSSLNSALPSPDLISKLPSRYFLWRTFRLCPFAILHTISRRRFLACCFSNKPERYPFSRGNFDSSLTIAQTACPVCVCRASFWTFSNSSLDRIETIPLCHYHLFHSFFFPFISSHDNVLEKDIVG